MRSKTWVRGIVITLLFGMWGWLPNQLNAQTVEVPQFKYDPFWPNITVAVLLLSARAERPPGELYARATMR
jgi:hypothetical protein